MALPGLGGEMRNMTEDEMLSSGFGTGKGMGKVLEREGPLGGPLSQWREVGRRTGSNPGNSVRESRVGLAL